jgi:hypothetical protein
LDGNANSQTISFTISGLSVANENDIWFRWTDVNDTDTDAGLAVDNLSIAAVPEPATWGAISVFGLLSICGLREWRQRRQQKSVV